jgi:hypothetical protein
MKKIVTTLLLSTLATFALNIGEIPKEVTISGDNGGKVDGSAWSSSMLKDKVFVLFYVDPDKKEDSEKFVDALHAKNYDTEKYGSVAIINLKATWLPNFAIGKMLKKKQDSFPNTTYVKDKTKFLVDNWSLADDSSNVIVLDTTGKVLYLHEGMIDESEMQTIFKLLEKEINK